MEDNSICDDYIIHPSKNDDNTSVWPHFFIARDKMTAKCKACKKILSIRKGSTKGLHVHYNSHKQQQKLKTTQETGQMPTASCSSSSSSLETPAKNINDNKKSASKPDQLAEPPKKQMKVSDYFISPEDNSLDAVLARMTALDGLPFRVFITSVDLRKCLQARGFVDIPNSSMSICNRVLIYHKKVVNYYVQQFKEMKKNGKHFSLTLDEWTSIGNKRFMNINVHSLHGLVWNLGLVRIPGSMPATECVQLLKGRLDEYNLDLDEDVVCITTDGASVMKKLGSLLNCQQQLCFAHGIHLAVIDVLYNSRNPQQSEESEDPEQGVNDDDDDDEDKQDLEGSIQFIQEPEAEEILEFTANYDINYTITSVRKIVQIFRRSPIKNRILQNYVKTKLGKELSLILDCKTRWNSLVDMLERFILLKDCIQKALIDLGNPVTISDTEFGLLSNIVSCLEPIKLTVEALCRRDANLCTADASFRFLFQEVGKLRTANTLAVDFDAALKRRIEERRTILSGVLMYLQNPNREQAQSDFFLLPDSNTVASFIKDMCESLNWSRSESEGVIDIEVEDEDDAPLSEIKMAVENKTLKQKLQEAITMATKDIDPCERIPKSKDSLRVIKKEMSLFENGGLRGLHLQKCFDKLLTIPPTSVESERAFSSAVAFATKVRSRLGPSTLDALVLLRSYFNNIIKV